MENYAKYYHWTWPTTTMLKVKFSFLSKYKPKCFWKGSHATGELLKVTTGWSILEAFCENDNSWTCLDKSGLKYIFHW